MTIKITDCWSDFTSTVFLKLTNTNAMIYSILDTSNVVYIINCRALYTTQDFGWTKEQILLVIIRQNIWIVIYLSTVSDVLSLFHFFTYVTSY